MAYFSGLDVTPTDDAWIPDYLPAANERVAAHGGKYIARTARSVGHHYLIEGKDDLA